MKNLSLILLFFFFTLNSYSQEDFILSIHNQDVPVELDKEYSIKLNGKEVKFSISAKDTLQFSDELFSFKYPKDYKISETDLGNGITQFVVINGEGSGFMIQKFTNMNPVGFNEMMLNELTKESVNYGYELVRKDYLRSLENGEKVKVSKAVLTYKDDINVYEVMSSGNKDEGILVVTMAMGAELSPESKKLLSMMWDSLRLI